MPCASRKPISTSAPSWPPCAGSDPQIGALASFVGLVREPVNGGAGVVRNDARTLPGMTEKALAAIVSEAGQRWAIIDAW
jgi:molybdopterin synthase catalytic subunit